MIATFTIPMRAPSVNSMYVSRYRGKSKILSKEGKAFKTFVKYHVTHEFNYDKTTHALEVEVYFYLSNLLTKAKEKTVSDNSGDLDNFLKISIDSVFECLGLNDSQVCKITAQKMESDKDIIVFMLKTVPLSLFRKASSLS